mmetsp:Transcript_15633/g.38744  ORF Transcript_15633/g.38744 Transcript_15633/m.38744 type:complete len:277 (-) Transcript_15633:511-1341(-)
MIPRSTHLSTDSTVFTSPHMIVSLIPHMINVVLALVFLLREVQPELFRAARVQAVQLAGEGLRGEQKLRVGVGAALGRVHIRVPPASPTAHSDRRRQQLRKLAPGPRHRQQQQVATHQVAEHDECGPEPVEHCCVVPVWMVFVLLLLQQRAQAHPVRGEQQAEEPDPGAPQQAARLLQSVAHREHHRDELPQDEGRQEQPQPVHLLQQHPLPRRVRRGPVQSDLHVQHQQRHHEEHDPRQHAQPRLGRVVRAARLQAVAPRAVEQFPGRRHGGEGE